MAAAVAAGVSPVVKNLTLCGLGEERLFLQLIRMDKTLFVWFGTSPTFDNLAVAVPNRFADVPSTTTLHGPMDDNDLEALSLRLSKKTGFQCFVSGTIPPGQDQLLALLQKRLLQEVRDLQPPPPVATQSE